MNNPTNWFERKFHQVAGDMLPNIIVRLRGAPARLEEMVRGVPHDLLTRKPQEKWSAQEHAGHLLDLEPLWLARVDDFANSSEHMTPADLTNRTTHEAHHNTRPVEEILAAFRDARAHLLQHVDALDAAAFTRTLAHPRLKSPMRLVDHLHFIAEHDDHHLARMWALIHDDA